MKENTEPLQNAQMIMNKEWNDESESILKFFQAGKYLQPVLHVLNHIKQKECVQLPVVWNSSPAIHEGKRFIELFTVRPKKTLQGSDETLVC